jgi:hypothetical protein
MEYTESIIKGKKLKLILSISFSIIFVVQFLILIFFSNSFAMYLSLFAGLISLILVFILTIRIYYVPAFLFLIVFIGVYFKSQHWPYASYIMTVGTLMLSVFSISNSVRFLIKFRNNNFLKWFGFLSGIIVTLFMCGIIFKTQHWPIAALLIYTGTFLFILFVLAFVFTLPNSNYIVWGEIERKVFFRVVLTPMVFIFTLMVLIFIFSVQYDSMMGNDKKYYPYKDNVVELHKLEGIQPQ